MTKRVSAEAAALLSEAGKHKKPTRKGWFDELSESQQSAIKEAYAAMPGSGTALIGLVHAIQKKYSVTVKESSIRSTLRSFDKK